MVEIRLNDGQSGYDVIGEYIERYWDNHMTDTVIVSLGISHDGQIYEHRNEVATPGGFCGKDIEFLYDWWEGEKYLRLFGIRSVDAFNITGGIYERTV